MLDFKSYIDTEPLSKSDKDALLKLDKEYGKFTELFRNKYVARDVENIDEEFKKFIAAVNTSNPYYPIIKIKDNEVDYDLLENFNKLKTKFENFKCYLSKFYIDKINSMIGSLKSRSDFDEFKKIHPELISEYTTYRPKILTNKEFEKALKVVKEHPYRKINFDTRNLDCNDAEKFVKEKLKEKGYDSWNVKIVDGLIPRMSVTSDDFRISKNAKFSKTDLDGLYAHEICGHVGRRFYGKKTGLNLFLFGLQSSSYYDEGLAVWNSLNIIDKSEHKPNVEFNIAFKTIISYLMFELDFIELWKYCKELVPNISDKTLFKTLMRPKRKYKDFSVKGGEPNCTYFIGYNLVNKMDDDMRDDLLKYNIGPNQKDELDSIKEFLKNNKLEEL